jgi:transposase
LIDELREGSRLRKEEEPIPRKDSAEKAVRDIRRKTRREFSEEEKIRIVLERLAG